MSNIMSNTAGRRNIVLFCAVLINLQLGMSYSWSVFSKALIELKGWDTAEAVLPSTILSIAYAVSMFVFGFFQEKYGPRATVRIGALLLGGGLILSGLCTTVAGVTIGYGILHGCGVGACFSTTQATTLKWIPLSRQGRVTGVISSAYGLSSVLMSVIAEFIINKAGLAEAFCGLGVGIAILTFTAGSFFRLPEKGEVVEDEQPMMAEAAGADNSADKNFAEMMKTKALWFLLGAYIFGAAAAITPVNHISMIASLQGGLENGFIFVSIMSIFNCIGRLAGGYLGDKFTERKVLLVISIVNLANLVMFRQYTSFIPLAAGCVIDGLHVGVIMALTPVLVSKLFGKTYCAQNYGAIAFFGLLSGIIGSQLAGYMVDMTGNYNSSYIVCAVYMVLAAFFVWGLPQKKFRKNK